MFDTNTFARQAFNQQSNISNSTCVKVFVVWCLYLAALEREELLHDGRDEGWRGLLARGDREGELGLLLVQVPL